MLDYASEERVIFHGYFGLFVYDLREMVLMDTLDLESIGGQDTQGSNVCEVTVAEDGKEIFLHLLEEEVTYRYLVSSGLLYEAENQETENRYSGIVSAVPEKRMNLFCGSQMAKITLEGEEQEVYLAWEEEQLGDLLIMVGDQTYPVFQGLTVEAPTAEVWVEQGDGAVLVPNMNYYTQHDGKVFENDGTYETLLATQACRKVYNEDMVSVRLNLEKIKILNARVYDYWLDSQGKVRNWNHFTYEPKDEVTVTENEVRFPLGMNFAAALSSTIPEDNRMYRGIAVECDLADGNTATYYFVLYNHW